MNISQSGPIASIGTFDEWQTMPLEEHISSGGATLNIYKMFVDGMFVFIKRLKPEYADKKAYRDMFRKEYVVGTAITSEYFPHYIDYSEENGVPVIMMEYVEGDNLADFIKNNPRYFHSHRNLKRFLTQLLEGLAHLHSRQVVHLDLKPENIIISRVNNDVRIVDLGYCYTDSTPFTQGRTDGYAAPEQFDSKKHVDARTDIYAVGKILDFIHAETGFRDRAFLHISKRCTREDPSKRYQTEKDILRNLNSVLWRYRMAIIISVIVMMISLPAVFMWYHLNDYDFCTNDFYYNYYCKVINGGDEVELTYKYDWFGTYDVDMEIASELVYDGKKYKVTGIGERAFKYSDLNAVTIPSSVKFIKAEAFKACNELTIVTIPESVTSLGIQAFYSCSRLKVVKIPSSIKYIPSACFVGTAIEEINIPEGVTCISQDAFGLNHKLKHVSLPSTLKELGRGVFWKCESLQRLDIPASVTTIGDFLLWECPGLKEVYDYAETPQPCTCIVEKEKFKGVIYVPKNSVEAYRRTQGWQGLNIQPMPE